MTVRNKEILELVTGIGFMIFIIVIFGHHLSWSADVSVTWTDSTMIEDTYGYSANPTLNYGRSAAGGKEQVLVGTNSTTNYTMLIRVLGFKDTCDNYAGLIIDSMKFSQVVLSVATVGAGESIYLRAIGLDTNRNWVEGNRDAAAAQDCEMCWDSTQTEGVGTCASKQAWAATDSSCVAGAGDTLGWDTGLPADSVIIDENTAIGDIIDIYVAPAVGNVWKEQSYSNEGFAVVWSQRSGNIQAIPVFYGSEFESAGRADSISSFTMYGHTAATGQKVAIAK